MGKNAHYLTSSANGIFQDIDNPICFVKEDEKSVLKPGCLIIDVSCDEGMGFYFARPTTFKEPMFKIENVDYYAVDHTPSYLWESATRSISAALIVHLEDMLAGREGWKKNKTIENAINIDRGEIQKEYILSFQNRSSVYPYALKN